MVTIENKYKIFRATRPHSNEGQFVIRNDQKKGRKED